MMGKKNKKKKKTGQILREMGNHKESDQEINN